MKLVRFGELGCEKPGIVDQDNNIRDLSSIIKDFFIDNYLENIEKIKKIDLQHLPIVDSSVRLGACVGQIGKLLCIGLNYRDHAEETNSELPSEPIVFAKATSSVCGPYDNTVIPRNSTATDWEVELCVIIGKDAKYVSSSEALDYVAGYCVINDLSERDLQLKGTGQWFKGKSCDTFGPLGPWLVTADEIPNPQNLSLWLEVDGRRFQNGHTSNMAHTVADIISYLSNLFTLKPGDVISTGTPAGVGLGQKPFPIYLKAEQIVTLGIDGLGVQKHFMINE